MVITWLALIPTLALGKCAEPVGLPGNQRGEAYIDPSWPVVRA